MYFGLTWLAARLTKGTSFMEVAYPWKDPVACPTAQERLEFWKTIQPKRIQRRKLFPLSFLGLANSWSHAGNWVERRGKQLLLPEIPISRNWRLLYISHPDFCLKVFSTVARCWVLILGFSSSAPFTALSEQWLCREAELVCAIFNQCSQQVKPVNSWEVWSRLCSVPRQLGYQWIQLCSPCKRLRGNGRPF